MNQYCLDANVFITAWNYDYKPSIFPSLWEALANKETDIIIIQPVFGQIDPSNGPPKQGTLKYWLIQHSFVATPLDSVDDKAVLTLEKKYAISSQGKGADEVDILLIAYAKENSKTVVTLEAPQKNRPNKKANYKIPLICQDEKVVCINFIELLERLDMEI